MKLSVVVPTLNGRERLLQCLDSLEASLPDAVEVVVVNGPSSDGTTGAVRERDLVDVLVEISERNHNVSRNAGIEAATGDVVAFVGDEYAVEPSWYEAVEAAMAEDADLVTGPVAGRPNGTDVPRPPESVAGRSVDRFDGDNVAFDRTVLEALDGFDEYLETGGASDCAHRLAALGFEVTWSETMAVRNEVGTDGGRTDTDWGARYRSLAYRLAKNYGPRPAVFLRTGGSAIADAAASARAVAAGDGTPSDWFGNGTTVLSNAITGLKDGLGARRADGSARRNPNGISTRHDREVRRYDRR